MQQPLALLIAPYCGQISSIQHNTQCVRPSVQTHVTQLKTQVLHLNPLKLVTPRGYARQILLALDLTTSHACIYQLSREFHSQKTSAMQAAAPHLTLHCISSHNADQPDTNQSAASACYVISFTSEISHAAPPTPPISRSVRIATNPELVSHTGGDQWSGHQPRLLALVQHELPLRSFPDHTRDHASRLSCQMTFHPLSLIGG